MLKAKAKLKSLFAPRVDGDLDSWTRDDPSSFGFRLQVFIGTPGADAVDSFDVIVCTPSWLEQTWESPRHDEDRVAPNVRLGRGLVLMKRWSYDELEGAIRNLCDVEGTTWGDANRIGRSLPREYDYRYDRDQDQGRPLP